MKYLILLNFLFFGHIMSAQSVIQLKIIVNEDLYILTDVSATPDSIPNGRHLVVYKNKTRVRGSVKEGLMNGIWTTFYPNGQQKMKGRYVMGQPHGEWLFWGENGEVQAKFQYNKGTPIGHWQGYYYNHSKAIDIIYNSKGTPEQSIHYYQGDIISLNHEYRYEGKNILIDRSYYYKNFSIFHYEQLKNGVRNGLLNSYHDNGLVWESFTYENGRLTLINKGFSMGGVPKKNETFRDGNGIVKKYFTNGNLFSETTYKNGLKNDSVLIYDLGKKLSGIGHFTNGVPSGNWKIYSKFHNLNRELDILPNSNVTAVKDRLTPAPKEFMEGFLKDGYKHGTWKQYDSYGDLLWETNYQYGFLNGSSKHFQTRRLMEDFNYSNGNKNGVMTFYSTSGEINTQESFESTSYLDTNWYKAPEEDWITVHNPKSETHQKYMFFYPPFPGMEIVDIGHGPVARNEGMFEVQRAIPYSYWPRLIPAKFESGNFEEKEYIRKHLTRLNPSLNKHIDGKVLLRYKIDHLGLISDIVLLKSVGFGLDEVAINMVKAFPPLTPATLNGIPIPSYIVREFDFKY